MRIDTKNLISPITAAKMSGTTRQNISTRIKTGWIPSVRIDGVPFIVLDKFRKIYPNAISLEEVAEIGEEGCQLDEGKE